MSESGTKNVGGWREYLKMVMFTEKVAMEILAMGKIGHGKNGHGKNGHGKYGHGTNGHGTNGHVYIKSGHGNVGHGKNWPWILLIQQIGMTYARELILGRFKLLTLQ